jgi:phosphoribosylformylglycinamidine synthase
MNTPRVLILRAPGINRDSDAAAACDLSGARPERVHVNRVADGTVRLADYAMLIIPGGFSYGDHLGAGRLLAVDLTHRLGEQLRAFVADGRPVIGICNGFQVLVKAGLLPGPARTGAAAPAVALTHNRSERFECRWVQLEAEPTSSCVFTRSIDRPIEVPVAHGEGRIAVADDAALARLRAGGQIALRYLAPGGYPANPNGSYGDIAGICNAQGNVLGLMPHPENAIRPQQHPRWTREPWREAGDGLAIFQHAVEYAKTL